MINPIGGIIPHHMGGFLKSKIWVDDINAKAANISDLERKVGIVFQNPDCSLFNLAVEEEVEFGLKNFKLKDIPTKVDPALEIAGLQHKKKLTLKIYP